MGDVFQFRRINATYTIMLEPRKSSIRVMTFRKDRKLLQHCRKQLCTTSGHRNQPLQGKGGGDTGSPLKSHFA